MDNLNDLIFKVLDVINFGIWIRDTSGKIVYHNKGFEEFCNESGVSIYGVEKLKILDALEVMTTKESRKFTRELNGKNVEGNVFPLFDEEGNIEGAVGYIIDITEEVTRQNELLKQKNILRTIIDAIPDVIFYKDKDSVYMGGNKKFISNIQPQYRENFIGKTDLDIHPDSESAKNFHLIDKRIMDNRLIDRTITEIRLKGEDTIAECTKAPMVDENDEVFGIVGISRDITELKRLEKKLIQLSYHDKLTGLYNRTYFDEKVEELDKKEFLPFSVIMGDINGLKIVNDTLGHLEGDRFIVAITNIIQKICPEEGLVFRWGGDEIIILLKNTDEKAAEKLIEKIKNELINEDYKPVPLSISLGSSTRDAMDKDIEYMLVEAENKVYRKKLLQNNSIRSSVIDSLQKTLEEKNMETKEHTQRLVNYAGLLGRELGLKDWEIDELKLLATLHDIGKIGVSEKVLMKPGKLTDEEMEIMRSHTEKGYRIVRVCPEIAHVAKGVLTHHERWDGTGYPLGLKENDIPFLSRIIAVIDSYDAMTSDRVYQKGMSKRSAIRELRRCAGKQFDPEIVNVFIKRILRRRIWE